MKNQVEQTVFDAIELPLTEAGYELVDVEYNKQDNGMNLTVFIHKNEGIKMEDCQFVARLLDEPLEKLNPTNDEHYYLNVSSIGLDRPLKTLKDFLRNMGKELELIYNVDEKQKILQGVLKEVKDETLIINAKGKLTVVEFKNVVSATQIIKF